MKILMYDWNLDILGGGQKINCHVAYILQKEHEVTFICRKPVKKEFLENAYGVDLSNINFKQLKFKPIIKHIPAGLYNSLLKQYNNIAEAKEISSLTRQYDLFINCESDNFQIKPLSNKSLFFWWSFIINDWRKEYNSYNKLLKYSYALPYKLLAKKFEPFNYIKSYTKVIAISQFIKDCIKKYWNCESEVLYPFVKMPDENNLVKKENIIIISSRLVLKKKILEMINAFKTLCEKGMKNWQLVIAGLSKDSSAEYIKTIYKNINNLPVSIQLNVNSNNLNKLYAKSKIIWYMTGLGVDVDKNPVAMEPFGMAPVEAISHYVVPILFNGGGFKEIVNNGINGYLVNNLEELIGKTIELINNDNKWTIYSKNAYDRSKVFSYESFSKNLKNIINQTMEKK